MGILTDTIGFRTSNVTPALLRQSAQLMDNGANLADVYNRTLTAQTFPASLIWGMALSRLVRENGLVWTVITLEDRKKAGYSAQRYPIGNEVRPCGSGFQPRSSRQDAAPTEKKLTSSAGRAFINRVLQNKQRAVIQGENQLKAPGSKEKIN
jgi:hypothetical protein